MQHYKYRNKHGGESKKKGPTFKKLEVAKNVTNEITVH